ncbi:L-histidine N(alpha)-methyltransferase [Candidatus Methylocalor cossyra]|uniref:Histidine N-alpha-methyltransferase n=1 Tax=Candidatus Methylocalor cossyra TaxID=3108543 RepID=A0ABP1CAF8_9GAMM
MNARLSFSDREPAPQDFRTEVLRGLTRRHKRLPAKFFYDARGSALFEAICQTPEYYPTRTEVAILREHADEIARAAGPSCVLIEPGGGNLGKVRLLLEALRPEVYLPLDISRQHLLSAARSLATDYPWLRVHAVCMDYSRGFDALDLSRWPEHSRRIVFFPGSTIGNFEPAEAVAFLRQTARLAGPTGGLVIGVDLKKAPDTLHRAYNDAQGLTREFNRNLLHRINAELGADFRTERFHHYAFYHARKGRIEMHLISHGAQTVRLDGQRLSFADGEPIHTENSYKYTVEEFQSLAALAGYRAAACWTDRDLLYSVQYFEVAASPGP